MTTIHLVRHGQASFGALDYDRLSALGERQSQLLGEWIARTGQRVTHAVTGPMRRHLQTAEACLAASAAGDVPQRSALDDLRELDHLDILARLRPEFGDAEALQRRMAASADAQREFQSVFVAALGRWMSASDDAAYAESWSAFKQRCVGCLDALLAAAGEDDAVWVFTSGGPISAIVQHLLGVPDARMLEFTGALVNSGVTRLRRRGGFVRLDAFNGCAHLEVHADAGLVTYR